MTREELIAELWDGDAKSTALAIAQRLKVNKAATEFLLPWIAAGVTFSRRDAVRSIEYQAAEEGGITSAHGRSLLSSRGFFVGDGTYATWGEATIAQHELRISYQLKKRNGIDADIERHQEAIKKILAHGVTCLDEIEEAVEVEAA